MFKNILTAFIICLLAFCSCTPEPDYYTRPVYVAPVGLGTIVAVVVSWSRNKSILWAIIHGLFGWLYVIYALLVKKKD